MQQEMSPRKTPDTDQKEYAAGLKEDYPDIKWRTKVASSSTSGGMDVAIFVSMYMRKIWGHVSSQESGIPLEVIVEMASAGLRDCCLPYKKEKLLEYNVPGLKDAFLDEFLEWQSDALALHFAPKQHRVVEKNETVPFKGVRQPGGSRSGSFGRIIKVREAGTDLFFARKSGGVDALTQELDILKELPASDHNISLRASYVKDGQMHLIVRPWAKTDLRQFLQNPEILPGWATAKTTEKAALIIGWLNCLAVGLAKLHAQHIKHKDIKPANILLADSNEDDVSRPLNAKPVYCDFGLSKFFSVQSKTDGGAGTRYYKAPEQLMRRDAGRGADVFSLGCVFLELAFLLAGKKRTKMTKWLHPEAIANDGQRITDCIRKLPDSSDTWTRLKEVVGHMLETDPIQRPTAHDVSRRLAEISSSASIAVHCYTDAPGASTSPTRDDDSDSIEDCQPLL